MSQSNSVRRSCPSTPEAWRFRHRPAQGHDPHGLNVSLSVWPYAGSVARLLGGLYYLSLWIALPLAVFTSNGLLGLFVHWLALSGMASLLEAMQTRLFKQVP